VRSATVAMPAIDVVSDASVALNWSEGEQELEEARAVLEAHWSRLVALVVLDLTAYEIGNALLRSRAEATAEQVAVVLEALDEVCPAVRPDTVELRFAAELAVRHRLTLYDAVYAAVARNRDATLLTLDQALIEARLGIRPSDLVARLNAPGSNA
jgi:predicted nucleic acid-binding protein